MGVGPRHAFALLDEQVLHVREARELPKRKRDRLRCCSCKRRVVATRNLGTLYIRHYSPPGEHNPCAAASDESAAHLNAKMLLVKELRALIEVDSLRLAVSIGCPVCAKADSTEGFVELTHGDRVEVEFDVPGTNLRADVAILHAGSLKCVFEVWASHRVGDSKWKRLAELDVPCFEVDAYKLLDDETLEPTWNPPAPLPAGMSIPSATPCEACRAPAPPPPEVFPACAPVVKKTLPSAAELLASLPAAAAPVRPEPYYRPAPAPKPETFDRLEEPPRVVDHQTHADGRVTYRLRDRSTYYDDIIRVAGSRAEFEEECERNGFVPAQEPSVVRVAQQAVRTRWHSSWRGAARDDD